MSHSVNKVVVSPSISSISTTSSSVLTTSNRSASGISPLNHTISTVAKDKISSPKSAQTQTAASSSNAIPSVSNSNTSCKTHRQKRKIDGTSPIRPETSGTKRVRTEDTESKESQTVPTLSSEEIQNLLSTACVANPAQESLPVQLTTAFKVLYERSGIKLTSKILREAEGSEYGACRFSLNGRNIVFRVAKTTPTKIGQFVTLWKRPQTATQPLDSTDKVDFVVVSVLNGNKLGQFIFDKATLIQNKILSHKSQKGKMAFRIYSPSDQPTAAEAIRTKNWQGKHFLSLAPSELTDTTKANNLFRKIRTLIKPLS